MRRALAAAAIIFVASSAYAAVEDDLRDGDKYVEDGDWKRAATAYDRAISKAPSQVSPATTTASTSVAIETGFGVATSACRSEKI